MKIHTFSLLNNHKELIQGTLHRAGGVSSGPYDSLNCADYVGDNPNSVAENLSRIQKKLNFQEIVLAKQEHGDKVIQVDAPSFPTCDALITNQKNLPILIRHADCQAALIYDPMHQAIAAVHSGWKGSTLNIYAKTITAMNQAFGSHSKELLVCISPSLGPESAEFIHYRKELPESFREFQVKPNYFDFWAISRWQLEQAGILKEHIEIAKIDTLTNPKEYFSYRRDRVSGRNGTFIYLKIL